ncbi:NUDIX domain-containing protein [Paralimibaculum aggregatum]|uniref:NUDIX domain-containing protein n=1 Tax=Paralimibaculum aggregatum TaxID=3036245 RepID=A0ABQ6LN49_9RHOB|nr:NUDIX hydrolase [Limibaculum sp. NKW23]GMG83891.1 NUDIX domain-containing protein [Limibaculum sp. NKW23]
MTATADALPKDRVRDAATVVLLRRDGPEPRLLMGQRGKSAAFMPSKFVFPGGAVDAEDASVPCAHPLRPEIRAMLAAEAAEGLADALAMAAIRELWEETGLALAHGGAGPVPGGLPESWAPFYASGHMPAADRLTLIFRAITPPGRPRRFDARFFLVEAEAIRGSLDDFSGACDELSHLGWVSLAEARRLDLPFITEVVLGEVAARLAAPAEARPAPFFHHARGRSFLTGL